MTNFDSVEVTDRFFQRYDAALERLHDELSERIVATESNIVVSIDTGPNSKQSVDDGKWPITLSVSVPLSEITAEADSTPGYFYEDTDVDKAFRQELAERLYAAVDPYIIDDYPNTEPENVALFVADVGPASVTYDTTLNFPLDEVIPEDEAVYEVIHRDTDSTRVHEPVTSPEQETVESIIEQAERNAVDGITNQASFDEVVAVREVESSRAERERAFETDNPLEDARNGVGTGLREGDVFSAGTRTLVAVQETGFGLKYDLYDADTGDWVMRFGDSDLIAYYEHDPADWDFLRHIDDFEEQLDGVEDISGFISDADLADDAQ